MIKNISTFISLILIIVFFYIVISTYFSDKNRKKINLNRPNLSNIIDSKKIIIPYLNNDTNNVIEFNSGYSNNTHNLNRSFWELFKK